MRKVWDDGEGLRGYVSMEVDPTLADDTDGTIAEARALARADRQAEPLREDPGDEGGPAGDRGDDRAGKSINVTLIFSLERHREVMEAYIRGIERLVEGGGDPRPVASVASFFVSRVDTEADKRLDAIGGHDELKGKLAVANAKLAYQNWKEVFSGERWEALEAKGASKQWCLWASTSTKNPAYRDVLYVEELIGPRHREHHARGDDRGVPGSRRGRADARAGISTRRTRVFERARAAAGVDVDDVTRMLEDEGVQKFSDSFDGAARGDPREARRAGDALDLRPTELVERIWERDPTVWTGPRRGPVARLARRAAADARSGSASSASSRRRSAGEVDDVVLLGMGGSSLAPEVLRRAFGATAFHVLDTTHPKAIRRLADSLDLERTLFVVSSKSGATLETRSHFDFFWERGGRATGSSRSPTPARRSSSSRSTRGCARLRRRADDRRPLLGAVAVRARSRRADGRRPRPAARPRRGDAERLPRRGRQPRPRARPRARERLAGGPRQGRVQTESANGLGLWVEQLLAESTGKEGKGLVPAPDETPGRPGPPGARGRAGRPVRPRLRILPLGVRDRGRRRDPRDQPVRPAERPGGEGPNERDSRRPGAQGLSRTEPEGPVEELLAQARQGDYVAIQAFVDPAEEERLQAVRRARPERRPSCVVTFGLGPALPALDRAAAQGRRADRLLPPGRRRHRRRARRSPGRSSASAGSSRRRLRETMQR